MLNADVIPASINKPNSRNQVLTRFESQTPGRYAKVTANESGSPTSYEAIYATYSRFGDRWCIRHSYLCDFE